MQLNTLRSTRYHYGLSGALHDHAIQQHTFNSMSIWSPWGVLQEHELQHQSALQRAGDTLESRQLLGRTYVDVSDDLLQ